MTPATGIACVTVYRSPISGWWAWDCRHCGDFGFHTTWRWAYEDAFTHARIHHHTRVG